MNEQRGRCCRLVLAPPRCSLVKGEDDEVVSPPFGRSGPPFPSPLYMSDRSKPSVGLSF